MYNYDYFESVAPNKGGQPDVVKGELMETPY